MSTNLNSQTAQYQEEHRQKKVWKRVVGILACITVFCTTYALVLPAITMSDTFYCGYEEHPVHTEACYAPVLACSKSEEGTSTEICNQEENLHMHTSACYAEDGTLLCTEIPHIHDESCYVPGAAHEHNESCYTQQLICEKPLHTHDLSCMSNPEADVETEEIWERTFSRVTRTEDWANDALAIAQTQIGYTESDKNYEVAGDGLTKFGYNRYGAWYGDDYMEWNALFCDFCILYAGIPETVLPLSTDCSTWIAELDQIGSYYSVADQYQPKCGDLVFFDSNDDGVADAMGFLRRYDGEVIQVVAGDVDNQVQLLTYSPNEEAIIGYGRLPEKPISTITATAENGATVTVTGRLPDGAEVKLTPVILSDDEIQNCFADGSKEYVAYDIAIVVDGEEWQPRQSVSVAIAQSDMAFSSDEGVCLSHIDGVTGEASEVSAQISEEGVIAFEASGFSTWVISRATASDDVEYTFSLDWNASERTPSGFTATAKSGKLDNMYYSVEYSDDNGESWSEVSGSKSGKTGKNTQALLNATDGLPSPGSSRMDRLYRIKAVNNKDEIKATSPEFSFVELLDQRKAGFSDWVKDAYLKEYGGSTPKTVQDLYDAFIFYQSLLNVTISAETKGNAMHAVATVDRQGIYVYVWQYLDEDHQWQTLTDDQTNDINLSNIEILLHGGKQIRCNVYQNNADTGALELCGTSNVLSANPLRELYDQAIDEINQQLKLGINETVYNNYFYFGAVAADDSVPFSTKEEYADYLAKLYLEQGIDAVQKAWDYYLYDLYDPDFTKYPDSGDSQLIWPKANNDSFHANAVPKVNDLNYDFLENGVDYSSFITAMDKTATAAAAGDENTERKYDIDITADVQAKVRAPVAMVLQIQTSWQMFDLKHANALQKEGSTSVGACAYNTELGTLYDIKHALLRFVDYMEDTYPGNNLVLGITETRHATTDSVFNGKDANGNTLYVANDPDALRQGIIGWDIFGNCEHVHYQSGALENAVKSLSSNLAHWEDMYGNVISYDDIEKVAVIIGGPTENADDDKGYGCTLPWGTFQANNLNAVYAIRTNNGSPLNKDGVISWLDYSGNTKGSAFADGEGSTYTHKYVATNEDAILDTLIQIAEQEMVKKGFDLTAEDKYVDDVTVTDTVRQEFVIDESAPITATIYNKDGSVQEQRTLTVDDLSIVENEDGTTTVTYNFGRVFNRKKCTLHFGVVAQENYIGSNNVFTNKNTPSLTYIHNEMDSEGFETGETQDYSVKCFDTPQVNVPLRYETVDGEKTTVLCNTTVDLKSLGEEIPKMAEALLDNYPQINGTLSYVWVMPDGTEQAIGDVSVKNGIPGNFPDISQDFTPTEAGNYTGTLRLTFTPETVDPDNTNFSNEVTRAAVNPLTKSGNVWIDVRDAKIPYQIQVRKVWEGTPEENQVPITFKLLANGQDTGKTYTLDRNNQWQIQIEDLASVEEVDGTPVAIQYSVEESVPDGFQVRYSDEMEVENTSSAKAEFVLNIKEDKNKVTTVRVSCTTSDGITHTQNFPVDGLKQNTDYRFVMEGLPLDDHGQPLAIRSYTFTAKKSDEKTEDIASNKVNAWTYTQSTYISGTTSTPVLVMTNIPNSYELPDAGGSGTTPFYICGLAAILCGITIVGISPKRKRERKVR